MQKQLLECVPNISEGNDIQKIHAIANSIKAVKGVKLLEIDPGKAANRTVITFVGEPEKVVEAAFRLIQKATELIDMRDHRGEHPRFGAVDVCPLVPLQNISLRETVAYAHRLGEKVGSELGIPVFLYEAAAKEDHRKNLAHCRQGEYEGLAKKMKDPNWKPDFGPATFTKNVAKTGAIAIGARDFLIAYNINLNTVSVKLAQSIAQEIRTSGYIKKEGGKNVLDSSGKPLRISGKLKAVKGLGWYIEEYGIAQVSYNLTDINTTPVHIAFDETRKTADEKGLRATGSELVGLIPLKAILAAADYFLEKQGQPVNIPEKEKIKIAVKSLGLDDLKPFEPNKKILEYALKNEDLPDFSLQTLTEFSMATASGTIAPSGGSVAAYVGSLGAALGVMVGKLSEDNVHLGPMAEVLDQYRQVLLKLVNQDAIAYDNFLRALRMPKKTEKEKKQRAKAVEKARINATEVPFLVMFTAANVLELLPDFVREGLPSAMSDAAVGALCAKTAITSGYFNVKINAKNIKNKKRADYFTREAEQIHKKSLRIERKLMELMENETD